MNILKEIPVHFILSTGRTGSTLLSTMLNAHPGILSISEQLFTLNLIEGYVAETNWDEKTIDNFLRDFELFASDKISTQFSSIENLKKQLKAVRSLNFQTAIRAAFLSFYPTKEKKKNQGFRCQRTDFSHTIKKNYKNLPRFQIHSFAPGPTG